MEQLCNNMFPQFGIMTVFSIGLYNYVRDYSIVIQALAHAQNLLYIYIYIYMDTVNIYVPCWLL